ncbi:MAG: tripartite tricarboxylate transporter TctB family protein [Rubrivivax sp.]|nr:tripartite tricarboxylate transporter TctB family protein [Rubrivivax sp.]
MAKNNTVDAVVAFLLLALGLVVIFEARRLGAGWTTDGPGSGYFPFYIGVLISISALGILFQALFSKSRDTGTFATVKQTKQVASVLIPAAIYVLAVTFLGLYLASAIYIAFFMIILGKYSPVKSVLVGVGVSVYFFLMFEVWFTVPLYKGMLNPTGFLGY